MANYELKNFKYYENIGPNDVSGAAREYLDDFIRWCLGKDKGDERNNLKSMISIAERSLRKKGKITYQRTLEYWDKKNLTNKQNEIISLIKNFHSQDEVAELLDISKSTLKTHLYSIYPAYDCHNYFELMSKLNGFDKCEVPTIGVLTKMENKVFSKILQGLEKKQIADAIIVSPATIATHQSRLYQKLNIHNTVELLKWFDNYKKNLQEFSERKETQEMINSILDTPTPVQTITLDKVKASLTKKQQAVLELLKKSCTKSMIMDDLRMTKSCLNAYLTTIYSAMSALIDWKHGNKLDQVYRYFGHNPKLLEFEAVTEPVEEPKTEVAITPIQQSESVDNSADECNIYYEYMPKEVEKTNEAYRTTCELLKKEIENLKIQKEELETKLSDVNAQLSSLEYAESFISVNIF